MRWAAAAAAVAATNGPYKWRLPTRKRRTVQSAGTVALLAGVELLERDKPRNRGNQKSARILLKVILGNVWRFLGKEQKKNAGARGAVADVRPPSGRLVPRILAVRLGTLRGPVPARLSPQAMVRRIAGEIMSGTVQEELLREVQ